MPRDPYHDAIAAEGRSGRKRPPDVLPFSLGLALPLPLPEAGGWPEMLVLANGYGAMPGRWWDEIGEASNEPRA